jgi:hypothetical protein
MVRSSAKARLSRPSMLVTIRTMVPALVSRHSSSMMRPFSSRLISSFLVLQRWPMNRVEERSYIMINSALMSDTSKVTPL